MKNMTYVTGCDGGLVSKNMTYVTGCDGGLVRKNMTYVTGCDGGLVRKNMTYVTVTGVMFYSSLSVYQKRDGRTKWTKQG